MYFHGVCFFEKNSNFSFFSHPPQLKKFIFIRTLDKHQKIHLQVLSTLFVLLFLFACKFSVKSNKNSTSSLLSCCIFSSHMQNSSCNCFLLFCGYFSLCLIFENVQVGRGSNSYELCGRERGKLKKEINIL